MLPHTGQGAAQSLEDAVALGLVLAASGDVPAALRRYERVRSARTRGFVGRGPRLAGFTTTHSRLVGGLRSFIVRRLPMAMMVKAFLAADRTDPHRELR
jgi:2-polyprenyl-6-methoxyphenol hydroxylase-like FAD-dependent oxidoreductase